MTKLPPTPHLTVDDLQTALTDLFAPWVQSLHLKVESFGPSKVTLHVKNTDQLTRVGGMLCGQAMMAAADTAMVLALMTHWGEYRPCTTVQMNTNFLKPLAGQDGRVTARVVRMGKGLAFGEIDIRGVHDDKSVCRASVMYALL